MDPPLAVQQVTNTKKANIAEITKFTNIHYQYEKRKLKLTAHIDVASSRCYLLLCNINKAQGRTGAQRPVK
jgi:hypothetical protein